MHLKTDPDKFDTLQAILTGAIVDAIKDRIDIVRLPPAKARKLLEEIAFSVATILDGSRAVKFQGVTVRPIVTFQDGEDLVSDGPSSMHEYVFGCVSETYGE